GGAFTALRLASLIGGAHRRFRKLADKVDRIVAPCDWVCDVLRRNGVPGEKLVLCRQGLSRGPVLRAVPESREAGNVLRLGYVGRLDPTKGIDIVVDALGQVPNALVRLDIHGICQPGCEAYAAKLEQTAVKDPRIVLLPALPPEAVGATMRSCDLVV